MSSFPTKREKRKKAKRRCDGKPPSPATTNALSVCLHPKPGLLCTALQPHHTYHTHTRTHAPTQLTHVFMSNTDLPPIVYTHARTHTYGGQGEVWVLLHITFSWLSRRYLGQIQCWCRERRAERLKERKKVYRGVRACLEKVARWRRFEFNSGDPIGGASVVYWMAPSRRCLGDGACSVLG